jgi:hypothetical protein
MVLPTREAKIISSLPVHYEAVLLFLGGGQYWDLNLGPLPC